MAKTKKGSRASRNGLQTELDARASSGERFKNLGNDLFRQEKYAEAAAMYNAAVETNGSHPIYMSNLAATYLKLKDYEMAEKAASLALIHDPRMIKARFRRGLARKESNQLIAAQRDFETILREDPNCAEAKTELVAVQRIREFYGGSEAGTGSTTNYEYPAPSHPPLPVLPMWHLAESDSEDSSGSESDEDVDHVGNGIPCKHHNRKPDGCAKGASCVYSHAEDARSMQDTRGRNVCLYFILGSCKFGDRCLYSHSKEYLPELWGDEKRIADVRDLIYQNELAIRDRRLFSRYMGKGPLASDTLLALKRATDDAKKKKAKQERKAAKILAMATLLEDDPFFVMHLTLNKSTSITGDVISGLREIVEVTRAKTKRKALSMLSSPELVGVYITDAGIVEGKNAGLLSELVAYVKAGGTVVFGGSFKLFVNNKQTDVTVAQLEAFFQRGWGLPWQLGPNRATERKLLSLNTGHKLMGGTPELPVSIGVAGVHLKGVRADTALYLPSGHSQLDIAKFRASNLTETPIAFAEIGKGHLGFIGDSGGDTAITEVLRIMFRLTKSS